MSETGIRLVIVTGRLTPNSLGAAFQQAVASLNRGKAQNKTLKSIEASKCECDVDVTKDVDEEHYELVMVFDDKEAVTGV